MYFNFFQIWFCSFGYLDFLKTLEFIEKKVLKRIMYAFEIYVNWLLIATVYSFIYSFINCWHLLCAIHNYRSWEIYQWGKRTNIFAFID